MSYPSSECDRQMTSSKTAITTGIILCLLTLTLDLQASANDANSEVAVKQITWEDRDWLKHYDASSIYKECLSQEMPELSSFFLSDKQPQGRNKKLTKLKERIADHGAYHEKHAVNGKSPKKLFSRAKENAKWARDISQGVNWSEESASGKSALVVIQMCYLAYHNYLKNETYLGSVESISSRDKRERSDAIYNLARYNIFGGASKDTATALSILGSPSSKGKKKPWSASPVFFQNFNVETKYGRAVRREQLLDLDLTVGMLDGLRASCSCLDKIKSPSIHTGYCMSVNNEDFLALVDRQEKLLRLLLSAGGEVSPSLIDGSKSAKVKVSDFPELQAHLESISPFGKEDYRRTREARKGLAQTLLYYWKKGEAEALSCTVDIMSPGRSYTVTRGSSKG